MIFWILVIPGLACAYFIFLRPILKALPQLQQFYTEADGFWAKVSALGWHSASVAWGYFIAVVSFLLNQIDPIATALGDPDFKSQVTNALQTDPKILSYILMGISALTIAARLRSITKAA